MLKIVSLVIIVDEKNYNCLLRNTKKTGFNHYLILVISVSSDVLGRRRLKQKQRNMIVNLLTMMNSIIK